MKTLFLMFLAASVKLSNSSEESFERCDCERRNYRPRCGYDGKTYYNPCMARCANVEVNYRGVCRGCHCPDIIQPVCGDDGHVYANSCEA